MSDKEMSKHYSVKDRLSLICYDGINLFYNGEWTGLELDTLDIGRATIDFLATLNDEQVEEWIRLEKVKLDASRMKVWNKLKDTGEKA